MTPGDRFDCKRARNRRSHPPSFSDIMVLASKGPAAPGGPARGYCLLARVMAGPGITGGNEKACQTLIPGSVGAQPW